MIERLFPNYILTAEDALDFLPRWIDMLGGDQLDGMIADERVGAEGTSWTVIEPFRAFSPTFGTTLTVAITFATDDIDDVSFYRFDLRQTEPSRRFLFRHDMHPGHENDPGHDGKQTHVHWLENSNRLGSASASLADIAALVARFHTDLGPRR